MRPFILHSVADGRTPSGREEGAAAGSRGRHCLTVKMILLCVRQRIKDWRTNNKPLVPHRSMHRTLSNAVDVDNVEHVNLIRLPIKK